MILVCYASDKIIVFFTTACRPNWIRSQLITQVAFTRTRYYECITRRQWQDKVSYYVLLLLFFWFSASTLHNSAYYFVYVRINLVYSSDDIVPLFYIMAYLLFFHILKIREVWGFTLKFGLYININFA